jgi:hypothetical protein
MYSIEALERGIEDIKKNIKIFEQTIDLERKRIDEYYGMIEVLKQKEREKRSAVQIQKSINEQVEKLTNEHKN